MLADLLLHAGSVVSMDGLIDDLWGAEPPPTAEAVVQNAVSRLRKELGRELIETRAPDMCCASIPARSTHGASSGSSTTHDRCRRASARPLCATRSPCGAGQPFADLAYETFLQEEIARLEELRLTALEDRIEAEIELGHHDVIADAAALGSQHPDRERLCRLLMLALHRAGRQQEALDAYEATRRALDEQWGLEPPETRALQRDDPHAGPAIAHAEPVSRAAAPCAVPFLSDACRAAPRRRALPRGRGGDAGGGPPDRRGRRRPSRRCAITRVGEWSWSLRSAPTGRTRTTSCAPLARDRAPRDPRAAATSRHGSPSGREGCSSRTAALCWWERRRRTRRALHDADANEIQPTAVAARLGGDAFELDADGRLLGVRPGRPRLDRRQRPARRPIGRARAARTSSTVVETGRPHHAVVVGEAGIGRASLVAAFVDEVEAVVLEAACIPYGEGISFLPLRELAERAATLDDDAPQLGELSERRRRPSGCPRAPRALHGLGPAGRRPRRRSLGRSDVPRPRRVRRARCGRPAARDLRDPAGAPRAAPRPGARARPCWTPSR